MFRKVRLRTTVYQLAVIAAVLLVVFAVSCVFNYERMLRDISDNLSVIEKIGMGTQPGETSGRKGVTVKVYEDNHYKASTNDFYDEETIKKIVYTITEGEGRTNLDGKYIAYKVNESDNYYLIYVYDYSEDYKAFVSDLVMILLIGLSTMAVVALFITIFTNKNLAPLEDAFVKQEELVANASHELKTPLTIINTNLSILNSTADELSDEQKKWLQGIGTQVNRMSDMINEMLLLARFEAFREKDFAKINFSDIVESVALETEVMAFEKEIEMSSDIEKNVCVSARRADLEKLTYILMENAMKYTKPHETITVSLKSEKRRAVLRVRNTGEGIPADRIPKLFDRFYRVDEAHTESGSFGLGLAIAKAIVDSNNGTIGVDSKVGKYTEFIAVFKQIS